MPVGALQHPGGGQRAQPAGHGQPLGTGWADWLSGPVSRQAFDDFIFAFFAVEMIIKMIALGLFGQKCYLGDTWNRLDFFIVMAGYEPRPQRQGGPGRPSRPQSHPHLAQPIPRSGPGGGGALCRGPGETAGGGEPGGPLPGDPTRILSSRCQQWGGGTDTDGREWDGARRCPRRL